MGAIIEIPGCSRTVNTAFESKRKHSPGAHDRKPDAIQQHVPPLDAGARQVFEEHREFCKQVNDSSV